MFWFFTIIYSNIRTLVLSYSWHYLHYITHNLLPKLLYNTIIQLNFFIFQKNKVILISWSFFMTTASLFRSSAWFSIGTSAHSFLFSAHETKYRCSINCYQLLYTKSFPCIGIPDSLPYIASISCFRRSLHYGHYWAFYTTTICIRSLCGT